MKLTVVRIKKFRAIRASELRVGSALALVGQNGAGKSSVLRALNALLNYEAERAAFEGGRHRFQPTSVSEIEAEFVDAPVECSLPRTRPGATSVRIRLRYKKSATWQLHVNGKWVAAPPDLHEQLRATIRYVYVPLRRDHEVSAWGEGGLLQRAVDAWISQHTSKQDRISPRVGELVNLVQRRAFDNLSKYLRKVTPLSGGFSFDLGYTREPDYRLLLRDLVLRVTEGTTTVDLQDAGSGTQGMATLALYSYLAEAEGTAYILGIEEPEQNLHPQAQRELLAGLKRLPLQVLFTTHSTVVLDELQHEDVVLCRRVASAMRGVEIATTQLPSTFWSDSGLDRERYYQFHRRRNSEFFYSNFVVLTESPIDAEVVREILVRAKTEPAQHGVAILSVDGVTSLPYAYHLLKALKLEFATVVDKDYFMPYANDELDKSRDGYGFPKYKKSYKSTSLLAEMVPDPAERDRLLTLFHANHSRAMNMLEPAGVFCFRWSMEVDLVNSKTACGLLFSHLGVGASDQTKRELLVARYKQLKKLDTVLPVVRALDPANLPNSYKRLRKALPELIRKTLP